MKRRLLAVLAGLALGAGGALLAAAPAQANDVTPETNVFFAEVCDGAYVFFESDQELVWSVVVDGEPFWPAAGDEQPEPGELAAVFIPFEDPTDPDRNVDVVVDYEGSTEPELAATLEPDEICLEPSVTQPTCDDDKGEIVIPGLIDGLKESQFLESRFELDGVDVDPESAHAVEPGTHTITQFISGGELPIEVRARVWTIEIVAPECPDQPGPSDSPDLPATGGRTGPLAAAALLLIVAGAGLFLVGRRRRLTSQV